MIRIGIDLGGTKTEGAAMSASGELLARERMPTPHDYAGTLDVIAALVARLESDHGPARIGVCHPGSLSPATGRIRNSNSHWLNDRPLGKDLDRHLGRPVRLANDADCFALSEARDGAGAGRRVVFGAILGTGVGGGIVIDGAFWMAPRALPANGATTPCPGPRRTNCPARPAGAASRAVSRPGCRGRAWRRTTPAGPATRSMPARSPRPNTPPAATRWNAMSTGWRGPLPA